MKHSYIKWIHNKKLRNKLYKHYQKKTLSNTIINMIKLSLWYWSNGDIIRAKQSKQYWKNDIRRYYIKSATTNKCETLWFIPSIAQHHKYDFK